MKKTLTLVLVICMIACSCLALTACNKETEEEIITDFTVGICQYAKFDALDNATQGFEDALIEEMQKAGKTVKFVADCADENDIFCAAIVTSFVKKGYDLIMANATPALHAAATVTNTIPILGTSITDYDRALGDNLRTNISGTSDLADIQGQADMINELFPDKTKIGLLFSSDEQNSIYQANEMTVALKKLGKDVQNYALSKDADLETQLNAAIDDKVEVLYIPTDNRCAANVKKIDTKCRAARIPVIAGEEGICKGCGVATLSIDYYKLGQITGKMAADILLRGEDISKMPIRYDTNQTKKYNKANCTLLGVTPPKDYVQID